MDLRLELLAPVPGKFLKDKTYRDEELTSLDSAYNFKGPADKYHANIHVVSNYVSMDSVKAWIQSGNPGLNMDTWSMRNTGSGGIRANVHGQEFYISPEIVKTLRADHEFSQFYVLVKNSWSAELSYTEKEWLGDMLSCYVSSRSIKEMLSRRMQYLQETADEELLSRIEEYTEYGQWSKPDLFGLLGSAYTYAKRHRMALYASLDD